VYNNLLEMLKSLAEIAIEEGFLVRDRVVDAARIAEQQREPLVAVLVRDFGVDGMELVAAIQRHVRVPIRDPAQTNLDPEALRKVPRDLCRRLRVLPLALATFDTGPQVLEVAMADPTDAIALAEVEHVSDCRVEVSVMPIFAVEEMVEQGYRQYVTEVIRKEVTSEFGQVGIRKAIIPSTIPYHRLSDEASLEVRFQALFNILVEKQVLTEDEFEERVRIFMKQRTVED